MVKVAPHGKRALKAGLPPINWKRHVSRVEQRACRADVWLISLEAPEGRRIELWDERLDFHWQRPDVMIPML